MQVLTRHLPYVSHRCVRSPRDWFLAGRRVNKGEPAEELTISRATLHRRIGSRHRLPAEILRSPSSASITRLRRNAARRGSRTS
jgi:hypothetical protein